MIAAVGVIALGVVVQKLSESGVLAKYVPLPTAPHAATKPFGTFAEFYPFYLQEHSAQMTKRLHYVGTLLFLAMLAGTPSLLLPLAAGLSLGFTLFPYMRHIPSGLLEMVAMLGMYILCGKWITGSWRTTLLPPVVAYAFAWVGHFVFEGNRPATFIYPTFSLMGDFRMLYDALFTGKVPL